METTDRIERELVLPAPPERVWEALTDPAQVSAWFGTQTEIDLRPGGAAVFGWPKGERFLAVVEAVEPPRRFAFRWCLEADTPVEAGPSTLVEFSLEPVPDGTRLRLVESGFAELPDEVRDGHLKDNTEGWAEEMSELASMLVGAVT